MKKFNEFEKPGVKYKKKMPAGQYYLGDPADIFDKSWKQIVLMTNNFRKDKLFALDIFVHNIGVGNYSTNEPQWLVIKSGFLALMPVALLEVDNKVSIENIIDNSYERYICDYPKDFEIVVYDDNVICIGLTELDANMNYM